MNPLLMQFVRVALCLLLVVSCEDRASVLFVVTLSLLQHCNKDPEPSPGRRDLIPSVHIDLKCANFTRIIFTCSL